ncbi:mechanosensitive ion channel family protein [Pelotomaculum terephthalicicum JT]|uniref:mechanosensitive ion channel family protein n=1 Tax=Pelotomaculum terephthalicicum TaxID=206393 RepID=UPI0009C6B617|nr:mechanosensitive ion channel family protein [Pelotomaculum terephthalicicum]MCG9968354.1 mechanosensitive ion channel family protein [Pelotomaculum terephthalicicum JT]OPY61246.1 MAG: putative MscS family protein YkuT [Pelotomaculum sp. PtaU1.Bin065]
MQQYWEIIANFFNGWLTPEKITYFSTNLLLSVAVLFATYLFIKLFSYLLDRTLKEGGKEKQIFSDNFIRSSRTFLKALLLYGGYFIAAIIILEIFNVMVISPGDLKSLGANVLKIISVLVGARIVINFGKLAIQQFFERHELKENIMENRRAQTLEILLQSVLTYLIFFLAGLTILQIFNINTSAILASAGILGLAVGFGAQNLVKDIISGFFILLEDQFGVGDFVETAGVVGTVEEIGLRTCKIRRWTGQLHIIPNGEITKVTNYNKGPILALVTVGIAYEEDIDRAMEILQNECVKARREIEAIVDLPQVQGVTDLTDSSVNIRAVAPSIPGEQWTVERELRRRFKYALEQAGIEIPYPRRVLYIHEET